MGASITVQANVISSVANFMKPKIVDYKTQYDTIYRTVGELKTAWKGSDNQAFCTKIEGFKTYFDKLNNLMNDYMDFLNKTAKVYSQTQSDIANAANKL